MFFSNKPQPIKQSQPTIKDKVFGMLDSGSSVSDVEAALKIDRLKIKEIKSDWIVMNNKRLSDRRKSYLEDNAERTRAATKIKREEQREQRKIDAKKADEERAAKRGKK